MSVPEYEKRFSDLVRLVPYIQADEVLKCKRFLAGLQHRIRVHLSVVPHNIFGNLVEAALRFIKVLRLCIKVGKKVRGVHHALPNRARVSPAE